MAWIRCMGNPGGSLKVRTASGAIASFETNMVDVLQSVKCEINAMQSGSGTPSPENVRPISGYTEANITRCGKNLFDFENWIRSKNVNYTKDGNKYTFNITGTLYTQPFVFSDVDVPVTLSGNIVNLTSVVGRLELLDANNQLVTRLDEGRSYISGTGSKIRLNYTASGSISIEAPQVELGNTASEYAPYNGQTYTVSFGQTVYGGQLDVTRGKLTVTWANLTFAELATKGWAVSGSGIFYLYPITMAMPDILLPIVNNPLCSSFAYQPSGTMENNTFRISDALYVKTDEASTVADFKTWLANNVGSFAYELATPIDIDLTSVQVEQLLGKNNVWHDANGDTEVKYLEVVRN